MMKLRILLASVGLCALVLQGCFLTQAQVFAHYALPDPFVVNSATAPFERILVDLNTVDVYAKHKDKIESLSDVAVVGTFTNLSTQPGAVEVWITAAATNYTSVAEVKENGTRMWGPGAIGAAPASRAFGWDDSAALFDPAGKSLLVGETKGDGQFTLYAFGTSGVYNVRVEKGAIILTLSGGV